MIESKCENANIASYLSPNPYVNAKNAIYVTENTK